MKGLFKFLVATVMHQKLMLIWLLVLIVVPFVAAQFTSADIESDLVSLARVQALWQICWLAMMLGVLYQATSMAGFHVQSGMAAYFKSRGVGAAAQVTSMWLVVMLSVLVFAAWSTGVTVFLSPATEGLVWGHWFVLAVQQFTLMVLVVSGWVLLAITLASRFGAVVGYLASLVTVLLGFYAVVVIGKVAHHTDSPLLDLVYIATPHYYLGDLTHRFVHHQGAMTTTEFFGVFEYLAGWLLVVAACSIPLANVKKK